jgi:hypothetical protein
MIGQQVEVQVQSLLQTGAGIIVFADLKTTGRSKTETGRIHHQVMDLVTIFTAFSPAEAQLVRSRLEAAGFHPFVANELSALSIDGYFARHRRHPSSSARSRGRRRQGISKTARRMTSAKSKFLLRLKKILPGEMVLSRKFEKLLRRQMVRRASARRRRPAPLHQIRFAPFCALRTNTKFPSPRAVRPRLRRRLRARARRHRAFAGAHEPHQGNQRRDFVAVVQPGVVTQKFQEAVEKRGLFYPPDPASRANNFIGGNIATNAGGPRCLKYGVTRDYVLGLEVVLADGTIVASADARTKTRPASTSLACLSARKVYCSGSSPRRP